MDTTTFLITVFCLIDDWLKGKTLRQRGPAPTLQDSEVLTIEIVGEFLGIDTDKGLYQHFRRYYRGWFPALQQVNRTTFVRQAANMWAVKYHLWQAVLAQLDFDPAISLIDSFPVPVCRFARAYRSKLIPGWTAFSHDQVARQTFFGLRAHVRVSWPGVISAVSLAPANIHDLEMAKEVLEGAAGWALADRNYWAPELAADLKAHGIQLLAPYRKASCEKQPWPRFLSHMRYRIETVFSQLTDRFHAKKVWARDAWHLLSRWLRKILSHSLAVFCCIQAGLPPLHFADLLTD
jgi:Transposase DDE domain